MRYIHKQEYYNYYLNQAHKNPPISANQARSRWKSYRRHKEVLSCDLHGEQYGLCAYSEIRPDLEGFNTHIEHIQPKSRYPERTFDYFNLVLSTFSDDELKNLAKQDCFGGHYKLGQYNADLFISCLNPNCIDYFIYRLDGNIEPNRQLNSNEMKKAKETITLLNLNSPYLINKREKWIDELDTLIEEHLAEGQESLRCLASIYLTPCNNQLYPFFSAARQRFGTQLAEEILK
jgi:uncharacterized protein (TIGR02646 family)